VKEETNHHLDLWRQ